MVFQEVDESAYPRFFSKNPVRVHPQEVQAYGELMYDIARAKGYLLPEDLVEAARPADALMHRVFEWDDAKAAQAHRIAQARSVIRSVGVVLNTPSKREVRSVANVALTPSIGEAVPPGRKVYFRLEDALIDDDRHAEYLRGVLRQLQALLDKHGVLEELNPVRAIISELIQRVE